MPSSSNCLAPKIDACVIPSPATHEALYATKSLVRSNKGFELTATFKTLGLYRSASKTTANKFYLN